MKNDVLNRRWSKIKADARKTFDKLTDVDMLNLESDLDKGPGILQKRYGYSVEEGQRHWRKFIDSCDDFIKNNPKGAQLFDSNNDGGGEPASVQKLFNEDVTDGEDNDTAKVNRTSHNRFDGRKQGGDAQRR